MIAKGEFSVEMKPLEPFAKAADGMNVGRMSITKTFGGDLLARSTGEMLSALTDVKGSAGYVAIEQVTGSLKGKTGSFMLQHFGMMNRGESHLILEVVPDSGTGQLVNLAGKMDIIITHGTHFYEFEYSLD